ncbi:MAG: TolC family outer membrane protein [Pseudomonadota bacterium]
MSRQPSECRNAVAAKPTRLAGLRLHPLAVGTLAALLAATAVPGLADAQSLADSLVTAYRNSPDIASARATVRAAGEQARQSRANNLPTVTGTASLAAQFDNFNDVTLPSTLTITLNQSLYNGGQVANTTRAEEIEITAEQADLRGTEQDVLLSALTAHADVLRDLAFVQLGISNVNVLSEQLRAARERFEVGEVTRTDVEQARASLAASRSNLAAFRGSLARSREAYRRAVGVMPGDLQSVPPLPEIPPTREEGVAIALTRAPALQSARLEREAAGFRVRSAIGALLPQISLEASASRTDSLNDTTPTAVQDSETGTIGVTMTLPFYTGGANHSEVREQQANVESAVAGITAVERSTIETVGTAYADLEVARASIRAGLLEVEAARLAFDGVQEEAKVGARTTLDVLDAEEDVLEAESDLVDNRRDETVAVYTVLAAIGLLTVDHLGLQIERATEADHYDGENGVKNRLFGFDATEDTVWTSRWQP